MNLSYHKNNINLFTKMWFHGQGMKNPKLIKGKLYVQSAENF